jgi:hypothetical protein
MPTLHQTEADGRATETVRQDANRVTPAEAKQVWLMLGKPSGRVVADWFKGAGRHVNPATIWKWQQAGWPGSSAADITQAAATALVDIGSLACAVRGDDPSTSADTAQPNAEGRAVQQTDAPPDSLSDAEVAGKMVRATATGATLTWDCLSDLVISVRNGGARAETDARALMLLGGSAGVSRLMMAASAGVSTAVDGFRQLAVLRAEEAAAVPGSQTVYWPGEGPHRRREDHPLYGAMEAFRKVAEEAEAGKFER